MLLLAEIAIEIVFAAALLTACSLLVYLVTLTVRERHLRPGLVGPEPKAVREPVGAERSAPAHARRAVLHRG